MNTIVDTWYYSYVRFPALQKYLDGLSVIPHQRLRISVLIEVSWRSEIERSTRE